MFVEFAEYITFLEDMQFKKHTITGFLHICLIIKGVKINKVFFCKNV